MQRKNRAGLIAAALLFPLAGCTSSQPAPAVTTPTAPSPASIIVHGVAFEDLDGDLVRDAGEADLPGVAVTVSEVRGRKPLSSEVSHAVTDPHGRYHAAGVSGAFEVEFEAPGHEHLAVLVPVGGASQEVDGALSPLK